MSDWSAIFIDTNIFIKTKYNFDGGHLERLKSFKQRPEQIIIDDVVYWEIITNFSKSLLGQSRNLWKAAREAFSEKLLSEKDKESIKGMLVNEETALEQATMLLDDYLDECGASKISTFNHSDAEQIFQRYFSSQPPFEEGEKKKHEFPDAFCLNAIADWANINDKKIVVVSNDKGWSGFAENHSERLKVVEHISEALDLFQPFDSREFYIGLVRKGWVSLKDEAESYINQAFYTQLAEGYTDVIASSYLHYDAEVEDVEVDDIDYGGDGAKLNISLLEAPEDGIEGEFVISFSARVSYTVRATFGFSVRDSIDKDMVFIGGSGGEVSLDDIVEITAILSYEDEEISLLDVDVRGIPESVNFGDIEPDFS